MGLHRRWSERDGRTTPVSEFPARERSRSTSVEILRIWLRAVRVLFEDYRMYSEDTLRPSKNSTRLRFPSPHVGKRSGLIGPQTVGCWRGEPILEGPSASDKAPERHISTIIIFGSAPPHFSLCSQSAVFPVCKKDLSDVEVFVDLLQISPDAIELFFRRDSCGWGGVSGRAASVP